MVQADQKFNALAAAKDSFTSIENLTGTKFDDLLVGDDESNVLSGGLGNDTLMGGAGILGDVFRGGSGTDTVSYASSTTALNLVLGLGGTVGDATKDSYDSIENAIGGSEGDTIEGTDGANRIEGQAGNDTLIGGGGDDSLFGGEGDDVLKNSGDGNHYYDGGVGNNTVSYEGFSTALRLSLASSGASSNGAQGSEFFTNIQNFVGGNNDDSMVGNSLANRFEGGAGNDTLSGNDGNDELIGGTGNDSLIGGAGADLLNGGAGYDTVSYATSMVGIGLDMTDATKSTGQAYGDVLQNIEAIVGTSLDDAFKAGGTLTALDYLGGNGTDLVDFSASTGAVQVDLLKNQFGNTAASATTATGGHAQGARFDSIENIRGSELGDSLAGNAGNNLLEGGWGNDTLFASAGSDTLVGGDGTDAATAKAFADTVSFEAWGSGVTIDLNITAQLQSISATDSLLLSGFENIVGSALNDQLTGDSGSNLLKGGSGNDTLMASAGQDTLDGGDGTDTVSFANWRANWVQDTSQGVTINLSDTGAQAIGGINTVTLARIENIIGSKDNDRLTGNAVNNVLNGGDGSDTLVSSAGADEFTGGGNSSNPNVVITDTVTYEHITKDLAVDLTYKGKPNTSSSGTDEALGDVIGDDIDVVIGAQAATTFLSGDRIATTRLQGQVNLVNTVDYSLSSTKVKASLLADGANPTVGGVANEHGALYDRYVNIQNLTGSNWDDSLTGDDSNNALKGGSGNDTLVATAGADTLQGGVGNDTASFANLSNGVRINLATAGAQSFGSNNSVVLKEIENLLGGAGDDTLEGDGSNNLLQGGDGSDTLRGAAGNDTLVGGAGADSFDGGDGADTVSYAASTTDLTIDLANTSAGTGRGTGDAAGDMIGDTIEKVLGSATKNNVFWGRGSNEDLTGGTGNDTFNGSSGADTLDGGAGIDTVDYSQSDAAINITLGGTQAGGHAQGDVLNNIEVVIGSANEDSMTAGSTAVNFKGGAGNDSLTGGGGHDTLEGGAGNDSLTGGGGHDTLEGGEGSNTLSGGAGNDQFFVNASTGIQSIVGGDGTDTLNLQNIGQLNVQNLTSKSSSIEKLNLSGLNSESNVTLSAAWVQSLVGSGSSSVLELNLGGGKYTIGTNDGVATGYIVQKDTILFSNNNAVVAEIHFV